MSFANRAITAIEHAVPWMTTQRWYGNKARTVAEVRPVDVEITDVDGRQVALVVARFTYTTGRDVDFFIPLIEGGSDDSPYGQGVGDAFQEPAFLAWFIRGFVEGRVLGTDVTWSWRSIPTEFPSLDGLNWERVRLNKSDTQSNTIVLYDDTYIGKMFRRLEEGTNPDLEIGEFLTQGDRFDHAPKLFGVVEIERSGEEPTALSAIQEFVPNIGPGWPFVLERLRAGDLQPDGDLMRVVRLLGERTGQMHLAFASDESNPDFAPERVSQESLQTLKRQVIEEIDHSVEALARHLDPDALSRFHSRVGAMMGKAEALHGTVRTRVHGDYHLGQVLLTPDLDIEIIDFEGEPVKTLEERRQKMMPLKDVAGIVRSLDYAGATVLGDDLPDETKAAVRDWISTATEAFIKAYRSTVASSPNPIVPTDDTQFQNALDLMVVEKALYEIRYEANNRPEWLWIPLSAVQRLAGV